MERTSPQILQQYLHRLSPPSSPPIATNLRRRRHNARKQVNLSMPLTNLILRRITTTTAPFQFRFNNPKPFSLQNDIISIDPKTMSDQSKETDIQPGNTGATPTTNLSKSGVEKQKESEKSTPPPPEKPLPGDCCGSGCVRCVWDVYYDELEEYNKLYKAK